MQLNDLKDFYSFVFFKIPANHSRTIVIKNTLALSTISEACFVDIYLHDF